MACFGERARQRAHATRRCGRVRGTGHASGRPGDSADRTREWAAGRIAALEAENQALKAAADQARKTLNSATEYAIVTLDLDGRITGWNEGARAILGYRDAEILGRSGGIFFPAEDRASGAFATELHQAMELGRSPNERWHVRRDGSRFWASGMMMPLLDEDGRPSGFVNVLRDNTATRTEEERRALLLAEMNHRIKNVLATVQAVATQTLRRAGVPEIVQEALANRLLALARSHDMQTRGGSEGTSLAEIVERALSPYGAPGRTRVDGPPLRLAADAVGMLNLAFHELATNAAKHGALSMPEGCVEVCWTLRQAASGTRLVEIVWREDGGPHVAPPRRQGFGSRLLEHGLTQKFGGTVKLSFHPEGLECRICLPMLPGVIGE